MLGYGGEARIREQEGVFGGREQVRGGGED